MASEFFGIDDTETHEQFIHRAGRVFSADHVRSWSRVERDVFNHLLGSIIHKFSYGAITDEIHFAMPERDGRDHPPLGTSLAAE